LIVDSYPTPPGAEHWREVEGGATGAGVWGLAWGCGVQRFDLPLPGEDKNGLNLFTGVTISAVLVL
jgi:hypothetical protein